MKSADIKKLYAIHSWVGLITGILLFVIAFTGALSVFGRPEIKIWANPEIRTEPNIQPAQIEQIISEYADKVPESYLEEILVFMPGARVLPNLTVLFEDHENKQGMLFKFDNRTLELIEQKQGDVQDLFASNQMDIADFIVDFHADLHLGRPIGLLTTGLLGLTLMASVVTGFIIHRQKLKQLFTFRWKKSWDITLADSHKLFGVWGLIFHGVIAFTGAFLGLATVILIPAAAFVTFEGNQEKLIETFTTTPEPVISHVTEPTKLLSVFGHALNYDEGMTVEMFTIYAYNDQNAVIYANAVGSEKVARSILQYEGKSGNFVEEFGQFGKVGGVSAVILDLMFPLHFGNFGGVVVKFIWTILGLSTALLPLSGLMLWLQRAQKNADGKFVSKTYDRFNKLIAGSCGGLILACSILFPIQLISLSFGKNLDITLLIFYSFFTSWLVATALPLVIGAKQAVSIILNITGIALIMTLPMNAVITGDSLFSMFLNQQYVAAVIELTILVLGLVSIFSAKLVAEPKTTDCENNTNEITTQPENEI